MTRTAFFKEKDCSQNTSPFFGHATLNFWFWVVRIPPNLESPVESKQGRMARRDGLGRERTSQKERP